jgi:hypothetical protein
VQQLRLRLHGRRRRVHQHISNARLVVLRPHNPLLLVLLLIEMLELLTGAKLSQTLIGAWLHILLRLLLRRLAHELRWVVLGGPATLLLRALVLAVGRSSVKHHVVVVGLVVETAGEPLIVVREWSALDGAHSGARLGVTVALLVAHIFQRVLPDSHV